MKFNTKVRYGIRAMLEMSMANQEEGIFQKDIARKQELSLKYLDHIISSLKVAGLVVNVSGKKSGYRLKRKPEDITVLDIFEAFESELAVNDCVTEDTDCSRLKICAVKDFWRGMNTLIKDYMQNTTLADLNSGQMALNAILEE